MNGEVQKYRPSNGTEGEIFMAQWCHSCRRDRASREDGGDPADGCEILARTFAIPTVEDPEYPSEWRYRPDDGRPMCTAFVWDDEEEVQPLDPRAVIRPLL